MFRARQGPGGLSLAVVGGQCATAGLTEGDFDPVAGHLQQLDGGVVDRSEPFVLDATGNDGDRARDAAPPFMAEGRLGPPTERANALGEPPIARRGQGSSPGCAGPCARHPSRTGVIASSRSPCRAGTSEAGG